MEFKQLRYLLEVAEAGSINRAADRLGIAQSAVSRKLAQLESHLGITLLRRSPEGASLTAAGQHVVETARVIHRELDRLHRVLHDDALVLHRVRLGLPPTMSGVLLHLFDRPLHQGNLTVHPSVVEASSYWLAKRLMAGELDCAVLTHLETQHDWRVEPLWTEALCLVGPQASVPGQWQHCTIPDLHNLPLTLTPLPDNSRRIIEQAFAEQGCTPIVIQEHEALNLLKEQVRYGAYSILPRMQARELVRDGCFCLPIQGLAIRRALVHRQGSLSHPVISLLKTAIQEQVGAAVEGDAWVRLGW